MTTTTHTPDELRRWCERAGGRYLCRTNEWEFDAPVHRLIPADWVDVLLPYVAELLKTQVIDAGCSGKYREAVAKELGFAAFYHPAAQVLALTEATPAQRCRAAEEVLRAHD